MLIYRTLQEVANNKNMSMTAINHWFKTGKVVKLSVSEETKGKKQEKKIGYVVLKDTLKRIVERL